MDIANLSKAADLAREAERLGRKVAAYREADRINVSLTVTYSRGSHAPDHVEQNRAELTSAEIGDAVVEALSRRLAKMQAELRALGVTVDTAVTRGGRDEQGAGHDATAHSSCAVGEAGRR
jgi:hypothetical protein